MCPEAKKQSRVCPLGLSSVPSTCKNRPTILSARKWGCYQGTKGRYRRPPPPGKPAVWQQGWWCRAVWGALVTPDLGRKRPAAAAGPTG